MDPEKLPSAVVCYADTTIALPILTAYALSRRAPRSLKRLYDHRGAAYQALVDAYRAARRWRDERGEAAEGVLRE